jgi:nucleoside-diphosphate-sugar epimerase
MQVFPLNSKPAIFLTGATGYLGSHLVAHLASCQNWQLHALVRPTSPVPDAFSACNVMTHNYDGSYESLLNAIRAAQPVCVIHLASLFLSDHKSEEVTPLIESNILLGTQLLEAMKVVGVPQFINTGTAWQHYNNEPYSPVNLYAATKQAYEAIIQFYCEAHGLKALTLKIYDTYGPNDPRPKLIPLMVQYAKEGKPLQATEGYNQLGMVHIEDICSAYQVALNLIPEVKARTHTSYGLKPANWISLKELVSIFNEVSPWPVAVQWGARPMRDREIIQPACRLDCLPKWAPDIPIEKGLTSLFDSSYKRTACLVETGA